MKITVNGEQFKSKTALLERIRGVLYGTPIGTDVDAADAAFLTAALALANAYYDYPLEQPVRWQVRRQILIGNSPEFVFVRPDGSEENPSIKRLSMQKPLGGKRPIDGARQSVASFVLEQRNRIFPSRCAHCKVANVKFEVHHDDPPFADVWRAFLAQPGMVEAVMTGFYLAEPHGSLFREFHRKHARLMLLCLPCHDDITYRRTDNDTKHRRG
jgi:hypothetical protein